jgi:hypothetical protein
MDVGVNVGVYVGGKCFGGSIFNSVGKGMKIGPGVTEGWGLVTEVSIGVKLGIGPLIVLLLGSVVGAGAQLTRKMQIQSPMRYGRATR